MAKSIKPTDLSEAIQQELTIYHEGVIERVNAAGKTAIAKLKKLTKASAPVASGSFRKNIATKEETNPATGMKSHIWYVKPPRLRKLRYGSNLILTVNQFEKHVIKK